ncbi:MAG: hypothetical protein ABEI96_11375 [Haloarculaceae archaeon]
MTDDVTVPRRARVLWGLGGGLAFLVFLQAFELAAGQRIDWGLKLGVAAVVAVGAAAVAGRTHRRLSEQNERS